MNTITIILLILSVGLIILLAYAHEKIQNLKIQIKSAEGVVFGLETAIEEARLFLNDQAKAAGLSSLRSLPLNTAINHLLDKVKDTTAKQLDEYHANKYDEMNRSIVGLQHELTAQKELAALYQIERDNANARAKALEEGNVAKPRRVRGPKKQKEDGN